MSDMVIDVKELLRQLDPEEREQLDQDYISLIETLLPRLMIEHTEDIRQILETSLKMLPVDKQAKLFGDISLKMLPVAERKKLLKQLLDETEKEQEKPEQETN